MNTVLFFTSIILSLAFVVTETAIIIRSRKKIIEKGSMESSQVSEAKPLVLFIIPLLFSIIMLIYELKKDTSIEDYEYLKGILLLLFSTCGYYYFIAIGLKAFLIKSK